MAENKDVRLGIVGIMFLILLAPIWLPMVVVLFILAFIFAVFAMCFFIIVICFCFCIGIFQAMVER